MKHKLTVIILLAACCICACEDEKFTVDVKDYVGQTCSNIQFIGETSCTGEICNNYKYNFEHGICPKEYSNCVATSANGEEHACISSNRCFYDGKMLENNALICIDGDPDSSLHQCKKTDSSEHNQLTDIRNCENSYSCNNSNTSCGVCKNGDSKYIDDNGRCMLQICKSGAWISVSRTEDSAGHKVCTNESSCVRTENEESLCSCMSENDEYICGECINYSIRCLDKDDTHESSYRQKCMSGQWVDDIECRDDNGKAAACNPDGKDCDICHDADVKYENGEDGLCKRKVCKANQWALDTSMPTEGKEACAGSCVIDQNGYMTPCGECINGEQKCLDGNREVQICVNGKWSTGTVCGELSFGDQTFQTYCSIETIEINEETINKYSCLACENDSKAYNNETIEGKDICHTKTCSNNKWYYDDENACDGTVSCKINSSTGTGTACGECQNGAEKCDEVPGENKDASYKCVGGIWEKQADCQTDGQTQASCNPEKTACGDCKDDAKRWRNLTSTDLTEDNTSETAGLCIQEICKNGRWIRPESGADTCQNAVSCLEQEGAETNCGECFNDSQRCKKSTESEQGIREVCINGKWFEYMSCTGIDSHAVSCDADNAKCGVCQNGEIKTDNYEVNGQQFCRKQKCQDGEWIEETGEGQACGDVSCKFDNDQKVCGECINKTTQCTEVEGKYQQQVCIDGIWWASQNCTSGNKDLSCADNVCGVCKNDEYRHIHVVNDKEQEICVKQHCENGAWVEEKTYESSCLADKLNEETTDASDFGGECINGSIYCDEDTDNKGAVHTCVGGEWKTTSCGNASCKRNEETEEIQAECGECNINESRYVENDNICEHQACTFGSWTADTSIANENQYSCRKDETNVFTGIGICKNNTEQCGYPNDDSLKNNLYTCTDGDLVKMKTCETCENKTCIGTACEEKNQKCENNEKKIGVITKCSGSIELTINCIDKSCKGDSVLECGECKDGETKCEPDSTDGSKSVTHVCINGTWQQPEICPDNHSCNEAKTACGECQNEKTKCDEDSSGLNRDWTCHEGVWKAEALCGSGDFSCNADKTACGECTTGKTRCHETENNGGELQTCKLGSWKTDSHCAQDFSCTDKGLCGTCQNKEPECATNNNTDIIKQCVMGEEKVLNTCPNVSCYMDGTNGYQCGECRIGEEKYVDMINRHCMHYVCDSTAHWVAQNECSNGNSCTHNSDGSVGCGTCLNYTFVQKDKTHITSCYNGTKTDIECKNAYIGSLYISQKGAYSVCRFGFEYHTIDFDKDPMRCYNDSNGYGHSRDDGKDCAMLDKNKVSCTVTSATSTQCGVCKDLTTRCKDSNTKQTCVNGTWDFAETCANGCESGKCK